MESPKSTQAQEQDSEAKTLKVIHSIYLNTISREIKDSAEIEEGEFRKPLDTPAYRFAAEYVANYLISNLMANTIAVTSKETDNYVRQRHDPSWLARKLRVDETGDLFEQLLECTMADSSVTSVSNTSSGRKMKPKTSSGINAGDAPNVLLPKQSTQENVEFIESQDFSQFTGVLTTGVGAEYTAASDAVSQTGLTFTELGTATTTVESTYDPRGVKAKPKPLPKVPKNDLANSHFKANEFTTMGTVIDTIENTKDYEEHKRLRNELKNAGIINRDITATQTFEEMSTTGSYLKPHPRYPQETIDQTWMELEEPPEDPTLLIGKCPFAKDFQEIVSRKKKMVSMGMQTTHQNAGASPDIAPAPPLPADLMGALDGPMNAAAASPDARQQMARDMLNKENEEQDP